MSASCSWLPDADPTAAVPTCPGWVLRDLVEHVSATQRWVSRLVTDQVTDPMAAFGGGGEEIPESPARWEPWLADGVAGVVAAVENAPSDAAVFDPSLQGDGVGFWTHPVVRRDLRPPPRRRGDDGARPPPGARARGARDRRLAGHDDVASGNGAVTVRGDAVDLLQLMTRRRPLSEAGSSSIVGDRAELEHLVEHMRWIGAA